MYSPTSDNESSVASCSDLVAALEALTIELQQEKKNSENKEKEEEEDRKEEEEEHTSAENENSRRRNNTLTRNNCDGEEEKVWRHSPLQSRTGAGGRQTPLKSLTGAGGRQSPLKSLTGESGKIKVGDMADKEKILNECKNQIKVSVSRYVS